MSDYQEAVQSPQVCFSDKDLKTGMPVLTALGLPRPICGAFASVYELEKGGNRWAVKCFLRNIPDQHKRYHQISDCLHSCGLPYFVTFDYLSDAILVHGKKFPLVKMEWVEAAPLNEYVVSNLSKPERLLDLEARWISLLEDLEAKNIAHGDLQHGNVLVASDGQLFLIDYDGMWVPALQGQESHETGHADYQSPLRTAKNFDNSIDSFAGTVIRVAIRALATQPDLWKEYDNGENLLLKRQDYLDPQGSACFAALRALGDPEIDEGLDALTAECGGAKATATARKADKKKAAENKKREDEKRAADKKRRAEDERKAKEKRLAKEKRRADHNKRLAEEKRRADEKRRAKQAKAAPAPKPASAGPSWMTDHSPRAAVAAVPQPARPAKPAKKAKPARPAPQRVSQPSTRVAHQPEAAFGFTHLVIHAIAVSPAAYLALLGSMDIVRYAAWTVIGLGFVSLMTALIVRGAHRAASGLFFGLTGLAILGNTVFELCTVGSYGSTPADVMHYGTRALLLLTSIIGIVNGRHSSP